MSGECVFLGSVSSQQRFGVMDIKALGMSQLWGLGQTVLQLLDKSVLQLRVTALFYLENSRKIRPGGVRACWPKDAKRRAPQCVGERERETPRPLAPILVRFSSPWACPVYTGLARSVVCAPEVLTPSSDLPLFYFRFSFLSFSHRHLDSCFLF